MSLLDRAYCEALDRKDSLAFARERFSIPEGVVYLDGNSLGALPKTTAPTLNAMIQQQWGQDLITSWNKHDWINLPRRLGAKLSKLLGAEIDEIVVCDSTSVNIFKVLSAALALNPTRHVILSDTNNFPTDLYMAQGLIDLLGNKHRLELVAPHAVVDRLSADVAVVMLTEIDYRTGRRHDIHEINARARAAGVITIWDLAHSAGAIPVHLRESNTDFAVGCGYKYLNGGPGAPGFIYVAQRWLKQVKQPLCGWFGHISPFSFDSVYQPRADINHFLVGTPPILSMVSLECGLATFDNIDISAVHKKSLALGDLMIQLITQECPDNGLRLVSPEDGTRRGSQVSYAHDAGYAVIQALLARNVIGDFRTPNLIRFGLTPLYTRYQDIWDAVIALKAVLAHDEWKKAEYNQRAAVT